MNFVEERLSMLSTFDIEFEGANVKIYVAGRTSFINRYISEFRSLVGQRDFVALDVKFSFGYDEDRLIHRRSANLIILYIETHCHVVKLDYLDGIPHNLREILADETISFVSHGKRRVLENENYSIYVDGVGKFGDLVCKGMVDLGYLAAKVLKASYLIDRTLAKLAHVNGIILEKPTTNWDTWEFSEKELKAAVYDARKTDLLGKRLVDRP